MSTTLIVILAVLAALVVLVLVLGMTGARRFATTRSAAISAPAEKIYPLIANFHEWMKWSPFEKLDGNLERSYSGPESGMGAAYAWSGKKAGAGSMEIIEAQPGRKVGIDLRFTRPMAARNLAEFTLVPSGSATTVTWTMSGPQGFMGRLMSKFMNMDRMVGGMFEEGLASMKKAAEA